MTTIEPQILRRGVVAVITRGEQLMAIRRSQQVLAPGKVCFPGGGIEANETEQQALVRELQEELNVAVLPQRCLWRSVTSWQISLAWWQAEIVDDRLLRANPAEVESIHWHSPSEMLVLPNLLESNAEFLQRLLTGEIELT
jgi:8-oxo-dGTP pyrophosphatase MutT (NUDIX family)